MTSGLWQTREISSGFSGAIRIAAFWATRLSMYSSVLLYPTGLSAFVVASEAGTSRNADESVELQTAFHEDIKDTGGEKTAHPSAFKNEPRFYR
jgi:hypothetical protein